MKVWKWLGLGVWLGLTSVVAPGAPVASDAPTEKQGPTIVPWADHRPGARDPAPAVGSDVAGNAGPDRPIVSLEDESESPGTGMPVVAGSNAAGASEPFPASPSEAAPLASSVRVGGHDPIPPRDVPEDFPIEAAAVGMVVGGALVAGFAWAKLRRRPL